MDGNVRRPRLVLPSGEWRWVCVERPINVRKKIGQTDIRQIDALRLPLDAASVIFCDMVRKQYTEPINRRHVFDCDAVCQQHIEYLQDAAVVEGQGQKVEVQGRVGVRRALWGHGWGRCTQASDRPTDADLALTRPPLRQLVTITADTHYSTSSTAVRAAHDIRDDCLNKFVRWPRRIGLLPPGESRWVCAARCIKTREKTGQTDSRMPDRYVT